MATAPVEPTPVEEIVAALGLISPLDGLSTPEYEWLATHSTERVGPDGSLIFREDEPSHHMNIILSGDVIAHRRKSASVARFVGRTSRLTGKLPFSRMKTWGADGRTVGPVWVLDIHEDLFDEMLCAIPSMARRCVALLLDRVRDFTRMDEQAEKLLALGKLAANLSHELNNPASAAQRSAVSLSAELRETDQAKYRLGRLFHSEEELERYNSWVASARSHIHASAGFSLIPRSPLEASDYEEEMLRWLEKHEVATPWNIAPTLAEMRIPILMLDTLAAALNTETLSAAIATFASSLRVERMADTVVDSSGRIFELISAIRGYSFMDQAPIQDIDLPVSIENTLAMFRSRMAHVKIRLEFESNLPLVSAYGSELNQAWSALIENALDAMHDHGTLTISIRVSGQTAIVEFHDDGPGIEEGIQSRIFEPFFTTKPLGTAMGLGLDTVQRIVSKHSGSVAVDSKPHSTCFQVRIPINRLRAY
ncbi:signal transduction histidine kinase [Edaphobacter modestus]|uniref:histidine kinase n=1 Tax=Edaphobacter modestus TaxID=388466 RepID=A0A4Q7YYI0_9BACT|nr:signal transduction histidine kinase [Edaphobacter modestus]